MKTYRHLLWMGLTGLSVPFVVPASAQTISPHESSETDHQTYHASSRHTGGKAGRARSPSPHPGTTATQQVRSASVTAKATHHPRKAVHGGYESLSVRTRHIVQGTQLVLGHKQLEQQVPGTNPLRTLAQMPGVQFQSDDPQGVDTYSTQLYMHGFVQNEIGMTLDGLPLGEPTFRNYNGLNPLQAISSENVERLEVTQSAGAESTASTNNLGGSINYVSSNPKNKTGGLVAQTFGSNALFHSFFRFDSGRLNESGTKFYVSYMRNQGDKWKGGGDQFMQQVNAKLVQPIGERSQVSAFFNWDALQMVNYQDYAPSWLDQAGSRLDNFYGKPGAWARAYRAAQGQYPASYRGLADPKDVSYYDSTANSSDLFGDIKADLALADRLTWRSSLYGHSETGHGTYASPYAYQNGVDTVQLNGSPIFEQVRRPSIERFGGLTSFDYRLKRHNLSTGFWYENNQYDSYAYAYQQPNSPDGTPLNPFGSFKGVPSRTLWGQRYNTNSFTAYVQDTYHPIRSVALHFGFKSILNTTRVGHATNWEPRFPALASGESLTTAKAFLPHISGDWHFLHHHELFFDISENAHAYSQSGYNSSNSPFAVSQLAYNATKDSLKPETAWTFAAGYRYTDKLIQSSLYLYRTNFHNRLQQILGSAGAGSILTNNTSTVRNVGGVTMDGVDGAITITPLPGLALFNSISYDKATYDQDIRSGGTLYSTKGQQVVAYPRFMYKARFSYEWRHLQAYVDTQYYGKRSYDYVGDYKLPTYWLANFGLIYTLDMTHLGMRNPTAVRNLIFAFNIYNLANTRYASTMGQNGFTMVNKGGAAYNNQSILLGAPRQFFGSVKAEF